MDLYHFSHNCRIPELPRVTSSSHIDTVFPYPCNFMEFSSASSECCHQMGHSLSCKEVWIYWPWFWLFFIILISPLDCLQWSWTRSWKIMYYSGVQRKKNNGNYYFVVRLTVWLCLHWVLGHFWYSSDLFYSEKCHSWYM